MNERTYNNGIERLRSQERRDRLEVEKTVDLALDNISVKSMLDVGTGSALFAEEFHKRNITAAGVDLNPEMIEAAKVYLPDSEFKVAAAEKLPFEDKTFDLVFMGLVFHEADDFNIALSEAKRVGRKLVALLEWPFEEQEFGPALGDRLTETFVYELAVNAGFTKTETHRMKNLVLYKMYL